MADSQKSASDLYLQTLAGGRNLKHRPRPADDRKMMN